MSHVAKNTTPVPTSATKNTNNTRVSRFIRVYFDGAANEVVWKYVSMSRRTRFRNAFSLYATVPLWQFCGSV